MVETPQAIPYIKYRSKPPHIISPIVSSKLYPVVCRVDETIASPFFTKIYNSTRKKSGGKFHGREINIWKLQKMEQLGSLRFIPIFVTKIQHISQPDTHVQNSFKVCPECITQTVRTFNKVIHLTLNISRKWRCFTFLFPPVHAPTSFK